MLERVILLRGWLVDSNLADVFYPVSGSFFGSDLTDQRVVLFEEFEWDVF